MTQVFFYKKRRLMVKSDINITPFVDVMLVLLVIFMVTSPMLVTGIPVDLPKTESAPVVQEDEHIVITIDKLGKVYLQNTKIEPNMIPAKLRAVLGEKQSTKIVVNGDMNVDYGKVVEVFGAIKSGGFINVALLTQSPDQNID
ncbi:ExbD/TolR family protein [Rickettsiales endosymbiont of Peranema trichophorum]|uniref:ExbD/TolR family protein n=1 Tax=Rickettsiales endosymbiont of Peranema trichophorum TaxID=2486577 RepID=UPI001023281A|nr:ExbD/TolR family protein [Rickettsiales endosymbiont of Peranema trichophorum]RZI47365.1 ExbD/TolR family protein [Rickettsiales endosymbiont of Peranema trichophorum]